MVAQLTSQVAPLMPCCTCCSRNKPSIYHPDSGDIDPQPQSQARVVDAIPVDPIPPPAQNPLAVPKPVDHYKEVIRRKPLTIP
ncbi:unnamed protein product, partial [Ilex paraguariensis]